MGSTIDSLAVAEGDLQLDMFFLRSLAVSNAGEMRLIAWRITS